MDMQDALDALENAPRTLALYPETRAWLEHFGASSELIELLRKNPFASEVRFGHVTFDEVNRIPEHNDREENAPLRAAGLLIIGSGLNGDPIVVDVRADSVGYVSHDELWEGTPVDLAAIHCDLGMSVPAFYRLAATEADFPVDYYQARGYNEKLRR